jgi:hypothetical protein
VVFPDPVAPASTSVSPRAEVHVPQRGRLASRIGEDDVVEPHVRGARGALGEDTGTFGIIGFFLDPRWGVEDLQHPLRGGRRLLTGGDDVAERLDRPDELEGQRDEGNQAAEGQGMVADRDRAEHDDERDRGVRDQVEHGPEAAEQPGFGHLGVVDLSGLREVGPRRLGGVAEGLQHPDAGRRLLDERGQVAF